MLYFHRSKCIGVDIVQPLLIMSRINLKKWTPILNFMCPTPPLQCGYFDPTLVNRLVSEAAKKINYSFSWPLGEFGTNT